MRVGGGAQLAEVIRAPQIELRQHAARKAKEISASKDL
jgi:hypothetical protein